MTWLGIALVLIAFMGLLTVLEAFSGFIHKGWAQAIGLIFLLCVWLIAIDVLFQPPAVLGYIAALIACPIVTAVIVTEGWWDIRHTEEAA